MIDRAQAQLRGPVRTCRTELEYVYPDHHWVMHTKDAFSVDGYLIERHHWNPDGSKWWLRFRYENDELGRLVRVLEESSDREQRLYESVRYSGDGTKSITFYPVQLDDTKRRSAGVSAEAMLHLSVDAAAIMTMYDSEGRPIRKVLYDSGDRVIHRVGFRYDRNGLLIEEGELVGGEIQEDFRNVYRYDAAARLIEVVRRWTLGGARRVFAYNDHGDVVEETIEQDAGITEEDRLQAWTERFAYEYEPGGNWTERVTETVSRETRISRIERRELAYY